MKRKITLNELRTHCEAQRIDIATVFANPDLEENKEVIIKVFEAFTDVRYTEDEIIAKVINPSGEVKSIVLEKEEVASFWEVKSLTELRKEINAYIDIYNRTLSKTAMLMQGIDNLSHEDRLKFVEIMQRSDQALKEINDIAKTRDLIASDLMSEDRLELIKARMEILKELEEPEIEVIITPIEKDGSIGEGSTIRLNDVPQHDYVSITVEDVKNYVRENSAIEPDELYKKGSFVRQTKEGFKALNDALFHFTEYRMNTGRGMEQGVSEIEGSKIVYQRISSFDEIESLQDLVWHMNRLSREKLRNIAILKEIEKRKEADKNKGNDER